MRPNNKIIGIIPARGGSKGLPRKNIKLLEGKPLISYAIEAALKSKYLERVVVSTEDKEIAEISKRYGVEIIKRPKELATDTASVMYVIFHALDFLRKENYNPDIVVLLQPTSPLRINEDIDKAIEIFLKNRYHSVVGACESGHSFFWSFQIKRKYLKPIFGWENFEIRKQNLPKVYIPNGAIFISTPSNIKKYKSFYSSKTLPYIMPRERSIDIDDQVDFSLAELMIKKSKLSKLWF